MPGPLRMFKLLNCSRHARSSVGVRVGVLVGVAVEVLVGVGVEVAVGVGVEVGFGVGVVCAQAAIIQAATITAIIRFIFLPPGP